MAWTCVLDPTEVAVNRTQLNINSGGIQIEQSGIDWGDAAIQQFLADQQFGSTPADYRVPNRQITIPLFISALGGANTFAVFSAARRQLQQKVALIQREQGWFKRGDSGLFADVVNATLNIPDRWGETANLEEGAHLVLECLPDFYGAEITLDTLPATTTGDLISLLKSGGATAVIQGDYPGRARFVVSNSTTNDQRGLIAALRARYYSPATTAASVYACSSLTASGVATIGATTGAIGGSAIRATSLPPFWTPVMVTDLAGTGMLTHQGRYRVLIRAMTTVQDNNNPACSVRLSWAVGDSSFLTLNDQVQLPAANGWYLLDLGQVTLDAAPVGTHKWRGTIQALGGSGTARDVYIDRIWFLDVDESFTKLSAPQRVNIGQNPLSAWDDFATLGNGVALNTRVAPLGGSWATVGFSSTNDFLGDGSGHAARTTVADGGTFPLWGRRALFSVTYTDTDVGGDFMVPQFPQLANSFNPQLIARYVNDSNFFSFGYLRTGSGAGSPILYAGVWLAGAWNLLGWFGVAELANTWLTIAARIDKLGNATCTVSLQGQTSPIYILTVSHSSLATGGTLASGQAGVQDFMNVPAWSSMGRYYDNIYARDPTSVNPATIVKDAVMFGSRNVQLDWTGAWRQSSDGVINVPVSKQENDLIRIPPSGLENRPVEIVMKQTRGDFDAIADAGQDGATIQPFYRPCWLLSP